MLAPFPDWLGGGSCAAGGAWCAERDRLVQGLGWCCLRRGTGLAFAAQLPYKDGLSKTQTPVINHDSTFKEHFDDGKL
jgi:hypothetical protein